MNSGDNFHAPQEITNLMYILKESKFIERS